jgi:hypothetical protein
MNLSSNAVLYCSRRFFCPVLYRVDLPSIDDDRIEGTELSSTRGSDEALVRRLRSEEFVVLLFNYHDDILLTDLFEKNDDQESALARLKSSYAIAN